MISEAGIDRDATVLVVARRGELEAERWHVAFNANLAMPLSRPTSIVVPETVVRWHRAGFKVFWRWKSRRRGRPSSAREIRELIRRMAHENETWGALHIHAELLKLGFRVSERTVSRYMPKGEASPDAIERWSDF